jgi:hypothetical protein
MDGTAVHALAVRPQRSPRRDAWRRATPQRISECTPMLGDRARSRRRKVSELRAALDANEPVRSIKPMVGCEWSEKARVPGASDNEAGLVRRATSVFNAGISIRYGRERAQASVHAECLISGREPMTALGAFETEKL